MSTPKFKKGLAVVSVGAMIAAAGAGTASAQDVVTVVPGDNGDGRTIVVNHPGMAVEVVSVDRAAGTAQVTMTNNTGFQVYCEAPSQDTANRPGGSISTASVVEQSVEYYSKFQNTKAEEVAITMAVLGSTGTMKVPLWPLVQFLPQGSVGDMASQAVTLRSQITAGNTDAKVKGLFGTTAAFALNNGATTPRTISLGEPATNPRGTEKVGFFTVCAQGANSAAAQGTAQLYAWSAYEEGWPPPVLETEDENTGDGALASGSLGSLTGSSSAPSADDIDSGIGNNTGDDSDSGGDDDNGGEG